MVHSSMVQADYKLALECGVAFVKDYYLKYAQSPEDLIPMYGDGCHFCHHVVGETPVRTTGVQEVTAFLRQHVVPEGHERKVALDALDSIPSMHGSVLILAKGCILKKHSTQEFSQTFLLAKDPATGGYCIANDTMQMGLIVEEQGGQSPDHSVGEDVAPAAAITAEAPAAAQQGSPRSPPRAASPKQTAEPAAPSPKAASPKAAPQQAESTEQPPQEPEVEQPAPEEPEPQQPEAPAPMSWANVAKGGAPTPAPAKQAPPKQQQQQQQQPKPEPRPEHGGKAPPPKEDRKEERKEEAPQRGAMSWAGLVAGTAGKGDQGPGPQRVAGGKVPARDYDAGKQQARDEDLKGSPARAPVPAPATQRERADEVKPGVPKRYQHPALYVSHLDQTIKESDIDTAFGAFGNIVAKTFRPGVFCFVDFEEAGAMRRALEKSEREGIYIRGKKVSVAERKSPEQRAKERGTTYVPRPRPERAERPMVSE